MPDRRNESHRDPREAFGGALPVTASRRARWAAAVSILALVGCATARRAPADEPDAGGEGPGVPADAAIDREGDLDADASDVTGTFGHCCFESRLFSCFCPTGATCRFGIACDAGGCVGGDGSDCAQIIADGGVE